MTRSTHLVGEIESAALDESADLANALRRCIALGGKNGSDSLRDWASRELKGYAASDELPDYRTVAAPLVIDGISGRSHITGQQVRPGALPEGIRDSISNIVELRMPLAQITEAVRVAQAKGESVIRLSPPLGSDVVALMNYEASKIQDPYGPHQHITRLYWEVHLSSLLGVVDVVRTTLVELAAEIRVTAGSASALPSKEVTDHAVSVVIQGNRNKLNVTQVDASGSQDVSVAEGKPTRPWQRVLTIVGVVAGIVAAVAAVIAIL